MESLKGQTLFITGASRGIGKAIALRAARDGANIVIAAKTNEPHPRLPGTIHSAAREIEDAGGQALPCVVDVRHEEQVLAAVEAAIARFGRIDIVVNNASAISLTGTADTQMKRFDLMHQVNTRGTFLVTKSCLPALRRSENAHVLNISPPLALEPQWFAPHVAYMTAKIGMSLCVLGMAEEFRAERIAVNALWPRTTIATAAILNLLGGEEMMRRSREPAIMADAAHSILVRRSDEFTGQFCIDEDILREAGVVDFDVYAVDPDSPLQPDLLV